MATGVPSHAPQPLEIRRRQGRGRDRRGIDPERDQPLVELKSSISDFYSSSLPPESAGSKWPKTSLGALKDGKRLTPDQLARLNELGVYPRQDSVAGAREFFAAQQKTMKKLVTDLGVQPQ